MHDPHEPEVPTLADNAIEVLDWLDPTNNPDRVPVPFAALDQMLNGLWPGQLITIGSRPTVGKSVVGLGIARYAALKAGLPVYLASLETPRKDLMLRLLAAEARVALHALRARNLNDDEWTRFNQVVARIADNQHNLMIDDNTYVTVDTIRAALRRMADRPKGGPARLVVVDYLQLMKPTRGTAETRQVEVAEMVRGLKLLARELEIPVVLLAQLNRAPESRPDKKPLLSDLRESGSVEEDSDVVILLHRDDVYDKESPRAGEMDLIVAKNRNGYTGTVTVAFQGHYARAVDMAH